MIYSQLASLKMRARIIKRKPQLPSCSECGCELDAAICCYCSGSGEGMHDGTTCRNCNGQGEVYHYEDEPICDDCEENQRNEVGDNDID